MFAHHVVYRPGCGFRADDWGHGGEGVRPDIRQSGQLADTCKQPNRSRPRIGAATRYGSGEEPVRLALTGQQEKLAVKRLR